MSGHSKWSTIKHKKAKEDFKRGKIFTNLIKEITVAARSGGGDPLGNPRLRFLLDKAKDVNMPSENSQRAIKRGTGEIPGIHYESYTYEGYGPGNSAVIIDVLTDNKNRAIAEIRALFNRKNGVLAESGAVTWMFKRLGIIEFEANLFTEDKILELLLNYDIVDLYLEDNNFYVQVVPQDLEAAKQVLVNNKIKIINSEVEWVSQNRVDLDGEAEEKALDFLSAIEELDDVQHVYTNLN